MPEESSKLPEGQGPAHFFHHQLRAHYSDKRVIALIGGTGAGKTYYAPYWLFTKRLAKPNSQALAIGLSYQRHVVRVMIKRCEDFLKAWKIPYTMNLSTATLTVHNNNSQLLFGSAENALSLEGSHLEGGAWIDEGGQMARVAYDVAERRTNLHKAPILITTVPYFNNWLKTDVYDPYLAGTRTDVEWIHCFDERTQVLTRTGWKFFKDVSYSDEFATRSINKELEWQRASNIISRYHDGDMYLLLGGHFNNLVTGGHRILVSDYGTKQPTYLGAREYFLTAEELYNKQKDRISPFRSPALSDWQGREIPRQVWGHYNGYRGIEMSGDDFAFFMGAYLAEGYSSIDDGKICISQSEDTKGWQEYKDFFERHNFRYHLKNRCWVKNNCQLAGYLNKLGRATDKYIPDIVLNATKKQLDIFWHAYWLGDGAKTRYCNKERIYTTSLTMAGQLQEVALKRGFWATVNEERKSGVTTNYGISSSLYAVLVQQSRNQSFKIEKVSYQGQIYCVTVPNGTLYVKRTRYPNWSGNCRSLDNLSFDPQLVAEIKARRRPEYFEIFFEGNFARPYGLIYDDPPSDELIVDIEREFPRGVPSHWPAFSGHDFGMNDPNAAVWARYDINHDILYIIGEYEAPSLTMRAHIQRWKQAGLEVDAAFGDPSGADQMATADELGYPILKSNNDILAGIDLVYDRFKTGRLRVFPNCKALIDYREQYVWAKNANDEDELLDKPANPQPARHMMDALRYLVIGLQENFMTMDERGPLVSVRRKMIRTNYD